MGPTAGPAGWVFAFSAVQFAYAARTRVRRNEFAPIKTTAPTDRNPSIHTSSAATNVLSSNSAGAAQFRSGVPSAGDEELDKNSSAKGSTHAVGNIHVGLLQCATQSRVVTHRGRGPGESCAQHCQSDYYKKGKNEWVLHRGALVPYWRRGVR